MKKEKWQDKIRAYALKNAIGHKGKARVESVLSALFHEGLNRLEIEKIKEQVKKEVKKINKLSLQKQRMEVGKLKTKISKRKERKGLPELPGAKRGKVIMRFSPSPSGPLHIGHALTALPSFLYVKKYGGRFYVRIEDTNPENIYKPAYKMIEEESKWLFAGKAKVIIQSDRMSIYYKYAKKLIDKDKAYVCDCTQKKIQENRKKGIECSCRQFDVKENKKRWSMMLMKGKKGYGEGKAILRFKGNMQDSNPALRDFPLARINLTSHALQKKKYRVYPLMNFAVAVDDIEQKMTHIIRAKEHRDNATRQQMIFKVFNKKYPWTAFLGRWHFKNLELSATKIKEAIKKGKYKDWSDKKLPTLASLKKQNYKAQALWKLAEEIGLSEVDKKIDKKEFFQLLRQFNR